MKVLVACEYSGAVRDAFIARGHDAVSCDLFPSEKPGPHFIGDVRQILNIGWDLMIAHPPCTYLANSGVRWLYRHGSLNDERMREMIAASEFFKMLMNAPIPHIAIENPIMHKYAREIIVRPYDQIVHPWMFGHPATKAICLWLKDLPPLITSIHHIAPMRNWREKKKGSRSVHARSRTFQGMADAMALQWGGIKDD